MTIFFFQSVYFGDCNYFGGSIYFGDLFLSRELFLFWGEGLKNTSSLPRLCLKPAIPLPKWSAFPLSLLPPPFAGGFSIFQQQTGRRSPLGRAMLQENRFIRLSPRLWATRVPGRRLQDRGGCSPSPCPSAGSSTSSCKSSSDTSEFTPRSTGED